RLRATATTASYPPSLHDALPIFDDGEIVSGVIKYVGEPQISGLPITSTRVEQDTFLLTSEVQSTSGGTFQYLFAGCRAASPTQRSEEHTSELQSRENLVCRLLLE